MAPALDIRVLGPLRVTRDGVELRLPPSRKVRVMLALLSSSSTPLSRSRLCDLLWDGPSDPRGELRWCLSKLRGVLDEPGRPRVTSTGESVALDLGDCRVDAAVIDRIVSQGVASATADHLADCAALAGGDFLEGEEVEGPALMAWVTAQRQRYRAARVALFAELARRAPPASDERFVRLEAWLREAPFDGQAHLGLVEALVACGRPRDAEAHLSATIRAFEQAGVDWAPLREAWQRARRAAVPAWSAEPLPAPPLEAPRRGSIVVMPFVEGSPGAAQVADGLTDDIITRLAKLRVLFVIARGSAYVLRDRGVDAREAGRLLNVEYVVSGVVRRHGDRLSVVVELASTRDAGIVWADELDAVQSDTFGVLDSIVDRIVASISEEIERAECARAVLRAPSSLDSWEHYHRGLWHMYRFTGRDNELAARSFGDALRLDPGFARAHAGLSFTHFQNVFLGLTPDRDRQLALALESASQSVAADDRDPAAHWALGRALWLRGEHTEATGELERSVELSPNFALGHYTLGFVEAQSGDPALAIRACDYARELSPFDPLQFGMLASRANALMRLGDHAAAADWAVKAAARPNAHVHILAIAALNLALANRLAQAHDLVARIRGQRAGYHIDEFLRAFRFEREAERLIRMGANRAGLG